MTLNIYKPDEEEQEWMDATMGPYKPWYKTKKGIVQALVILAVLVAIAFGLCGCAYLEAETKGDDIHIKSVTVGKDIVIDPNGLMSTVSPKNQGIIEALAGFAAGFAVFGL